jgi:uncharacterized membrane protein
MGIRGLIDKKKLANFGVTVADKVATFVGTWTFVFLYTLAMLLWITLHQTGVLHIDSPDFIKWNLWLSYFAGTQASIVLMSSARQSALDRRRQEISLDYDEKNLEINKVNNTRILHLMRQIELLEEIIDELIEEKNKNGDGGSSNGNTRLV